MSHIGADAVPPCAIRRAPPEPCSSPSQPSDGLSISVTPRALSHHYFNYHHTRHLRRRARLVAGAARSAMTGKAAASRPGSNTAVRRLELELDAPPASLVEQLVDKQSREGLLMRSRISILFRRISSLDCSASQSPHSPRPRCPTSSRPDRHHPARSLTCCCLWARSTHPISARPAPLLFLVAMRLMPSEMRTKQAAL